MDWDIILHQGQTLLGMRVGHGLSTVATFRDLRSAQIVLEALSKAQQPSLVPDTMRLAERLYERTMPSEAPPFHEADDHQTVDFMRCLGLAETVVDAMKPEQIVSIPIEDIPPEVRRAVDLDPSIGMTRDQPVG